MKKLGIIGGMSWESSALYYKWLNEGVRQRLGGLHSARVVLNSLDFGQVADLQHAGEWEKLEALLIQEAKALEASGCELVLIATNTMHLMYQAVCDAVSVPVLHIAQGTGLALKMTGKQRPLLLATGFTMEKSFYTGYLSQGHGIECLVPSKPDRDETHRIIYEELCLGKISDSSRSFFETLIKSTHEADAVILGCTELTMIINEETSALPLFDTTGLHVQSAIDRMLET